MVDLECVLGASGCRTSRFVNVPIPPRVHTGNNLLEDFASRLGRDLVNCHLRVLICKCRVTLTPRGGRGSHPSLTPAPTQALTLT